MTQDNRKITEFRSGWKPTKVAIDPEILDGAKRILDDYDFPTTKIERWKYTRTSKIANKKFELGGLTSISQLPKLPVSDAYNIVFINGEYNAELSSAEVNDQFLFQPIGLAKQAVDYIGKAVKVEKERTIKADKRIFKAMNTVYLNGGAYIEIAPKAIVDKPIQLVNISSGEQHAGMIRNIIVAKRLSEATISQVYLSVDANNCFTNVITEFFVEEGAKITGDKIENQNDASFLISSDYIVQERDAHFAMNTITLNGQFVRNNVDVYVGGENGETHLNGAYILKDKQHVDNHTNITHAVSNCYSNQTYKGVMDDQSTAVYNGMVLVKPNAQKIDSYQSNGNVLLSNDASVNSKPELEIYADDVKCSHGSTTGQLDEEAIFYMRARGISEQNARALMVTAFIDDVISLIGHDEIVDYIHGELEERFGWMF